MKFIKNNKYWLIFLLLISLFLLSYYIENTSIFRLMLAMIISVFLALTYSRKKVLLLNHQNTDEAVVEAKRLAQQDIKNNHLVPEEMHHYLEHTRAWFTYEEKVGRL